MGETIGDFFFSERKACSEGRRDTPGSIYKLPLRRELRVAKAPTCLLVLHDIRLRLIHYINKDNGTGRIHSRTRQEEEWRQKEGEAKV